MFKRADFPADFLFGAATAAYQIEGQSFGGAGPCHWDTFAATPGNVAHAQDGAVACDHYHRYAQDLDLMRGFDAYRFSTNWSRVLPEGRGAVNGQGLDFYDRLVDGILARGLKPFLTLYHWDLPSALADLGGWQNRDIAGWFADYSDIVMDRIGDRVAAVATINEPWCVSYLSHFLGHHAPGLRDIRAAARAMHHVLLAHGEATRRLRSRGQQNVGIVLNFEAVQPATPAPADHAAADRHDAIMNRFFIQGLTQGSYPDAVLDGMAAHLPKGWQDDMALIAQPLDWLGVNYYTRQIIAADDAAPWPSLRTVAGPLDKTQMGWEIYPDGLRQVLVRLMHEFTGDLPLYVTENGMARDDRVDRGTVDDRERIGFIRDHLAAVRAAIGEGANIRGFFYWSLLDNYEWAFGYEKRFGLVHVNFATRERTPKQSFTLLKEALGAKNDL
jgi:beta-glucosidase